MTWRQTDSSLHFAIFLQKALTFISIDKVHTQLAKDVVKTFFLREMLTSYDEL